MMNKNSKEIMKKVFMILVASFLFAIAMKLIVQPNKFLSGGVSGLTILISRSRFRIKKISYCTTEKIKR